MKRFDVLDTSMGWESFKQEISDRLNQGWTLHGGLFGENGFKYQAMVFDEPSTQSQSQPSSKLDAEYFAAWWRSPDPASMETERVDSVAMAIEVSKERDYMARPGYYIQVLHPVTAKWETVFKEFITPGDRT